jgi:hypothetical protein
MKKLLALLVVGSLLALTTGCPPGSTTGPAAGGGDTKPKVETTTGKVTDWTKPTLKVKPDTGDEKSFTIPDGVKVSDDVKKDVVVTVTTTDGKITAVDVKK